MPDFFLPRLVTGSSGLDCWRHFRGAMNGCQEWIGRREQGALPAFRRQCFRVVRVFRGSLYDDLRGEILLLNPFAGGILQPRNTRTARKKNSKPFTGVDCYRNFPRRWRKFRHCSAVSRPAFQRRTQSRGGPQRTGANDLGPSRRSNSITQPRNIDEI